MTDWQTKHLRLLQTHQGVQEMANRAQDFAKRYAGEDYSKPTILVICGETGSGKTHISKALYSWARNYSGRVGASALWVAWPESCRDIMDGYDGVVRDAWEAHFLALDDIGSETDRYKSGLTVDSLCQILSRRERKFTVVTTNISPAKWNERFDIRIADRLMRNSEVCDLSEVPSYSLTKLLNSNQQP